MRAFITGITGFAGAHLAEWLIAQGDEVAGSNSTGRWPVSLAHSSARHVPLIAWDLSAAVESKTGASSEKADEFREVLREFRPEVVYHLAALSVPADCGATEPTERAWAINVEGTAAVVQAVRTISPGTRLIFVSSGHVYGPRSAPSRWVVEDSPLTPASGYARTKVAAEQIVLDAIHEGRIDAVIARAFKHAGPRQDARMMLAEWCRQFALSDSPVKVRCLDSHLDLSDVRDVVRAYRELALRGQSGRIYNVGSGQSVRSGDLFLQLRAIADSQRPYQETDPGERWETIAVIDRLTADTSWRPSIPLEQTMRDTLQASRLNKSQAVG